MIPVKHYQLIYDCLASGLEDSYPLMDEDGLNWIDAKEIMIQNQMARLCKYLDIQQDEYYIEFEPEPEDDNDD